jgi:septum formation protein
MHPQSQKRTLVLSSTSLYRKILLERLNLPFEIFSPSIDETPRDSESISQLVTRLAAEKSRAAAYRFPASVIIGSDQLACYRGAIVGKPGNARNAIDQLTSFSGQTVQFLTAVSVICAESEFSHERTVMTEVRFRQLTGEEIRRYVELDRPVGCAGAFKSEAAGITLLEAMVSDDPTAIVGLPLITVSEALRQAGFDLP